MGFFNDFNEKQKERQEKYQQRKVEIRQQLDARLEKNQQRTAYIPIAFKAEYYGGYQHYNKKVEGKLFIHQDRVSFTSGGLKTTAFEITKPNIHELAVEGKDEVGRRITATRLLTAGVFALAWQKKTSRQDTFVTVVTNDGQEAVFHIADKSHMELKPQILQKIGLSGLVPVRPQQASSAADELSKLANLKDKGVLTQEEFDTKKQQILGL